MTRGLNTDLDRPNNFTKKAFGVVMAKPGDGRAIFSQVHVKDAQAEYLAFQYLAANAVPETLAQASGTSSRGATRPPSSEASTNAS